MQQYNILEEICDSCTRSQMSTARAAEIYSFRIQEYRNLKIRDPGISEYDYAVSFMRDYIWFGED